MTTVLIKIPMDTRVKDFMLFKSYYIIDDVKYNHNINLNTYTNYDFWVQKKHILVSLFKKENVL